MIKILHNLALFWVENANFFAEFFGENILKKHNIGPRGCFGSPGVDVKIRILRDLNLGKWRFLTNVRIVF
jgi:hypothetical protein